MLHSLEENVETDLTEISKVTTLAHHQCATHDLKASNLAKMIDRGIRIGVDMDEIPGAGHHLWIRAHLL